MGFSKERCKVAVRFILFKPGLMITARIVNIGLETASRHVEKSPNLKENHHSQPKKCQREN
jgi:hypothetical protein